MHQLTFFFCFALFFSLNTNAQYSTEKSKYIAVFESTENTINLDDEGRLEMAYSISGVFSEEEISNIKRLFNAYGLLEYFSFTKTDLPGKLAVFERTKLGVKVSDHRKLFVTVGIEYVEVDGLLMKSENFAIEGYE